jgi:hypothetical protein
VTRIRGEEGAGADSNGMKDLRALGASLGNLLADIVLSSWGERARIDDLMLKGCCGLSQGAFGATYTPPRG